MAGCCRFLSSRLKFYLSEACEGRLPRPGGMVDGKSLFLTSLREMVNLMEPILRQVPQIPRQFISAGAMKHLVL